MGFQHPKQKQDMMAGRMAAASSMKTPGHLKAHQQRLAGAPNVKLTSLSRKFMPPKSGGAIPNYLDPGSAKMPKFGIPKIKKSAPIKVKAKKSSAMKISSGPGCAIYG